MNLKRFFAKDMRTALAEIKEELGPDAIIMSSKKVAGGIEIVAAVDVNASKVNASSDDKTEQKNVKNLAQRSQKDNIGDKNMTKENKDEMFADSLAALLARQQKQNLSHSDKKSSSLGGMPKKLSEQEGFNIKGKSSPNRLNLNAIKEQAASTVSKEDFTLLSKEVEAIRKLLQYQLAGLMQEERSRDEPIRAMLIRLLTSRGFEEKLAVKLISKVNHDLSFNQAWLEMARILENNLIVGNDEILTQGGAFALMGPTGVGKTTTLAKLAARFALKYGSEHVALVSTDHYRIGASEQLQTYGRIMGCVVKVVDDTKELNDVLYQLRNKSLVLIDTAGFGQRDARLEDELLELERNSKVKLGHYLVLPGTAQRMVLEDAYTRFSKVGIDGLILTKLDESLNLTDALSLCLKYDLPLNYITTGQRVPEDIEVATAQGFVEKVLMQIADSEPDLTSLEVKESPFVQNWARDLTNEE
jgi:flagellar biosynthesis protein FlhF